MLNIEKRISESCSYGDRSPSSTFNLQTKGFTTNMLGAMRSIKMTSLVSKVSSIVHQLRLDEIQAARSFWLLVVYTSAIGMIGL